MDKTGKDQPRKRVRRKKEEEKKETLVDRTLSDTIVRS